MKNNINILVPIDFSQKALNALEYAIVLAEKLKSRIVLLHTYQLPVVLDQMPAEMIDKEVMLIGEAENAKLKSLISKLKHNHPSLHFSSQIEYGSVRDEICKAIKTHAIDIVITGSEEMTSFEATLLGSICLNAIKDAKCPVLVVPETSRIMGIRKIIFAASMSEQEIPVINELCTLAHAFDAEVIVVHIYSSKAKDAEEEFGIFKNHITRQIRYPNLKFRNNAGDDVRESLSKISQEENASLIAMLTHTRLPFENFYHPSMTRKIAMQTKIPLMVFHAE